MSRYEEINKLEYGALYSPFPEGRASSVRSMAKMLRDQKDEIERLIGKEPEPEPDVRVVTRRRAES